MAGRRYIKVEIPKWARERHIYVMAGIECLAVKPKDGPLYVKVERCNQCGRCCMNLGAAGHAFPVIGGRCAYLREEPGTTDKFRCALGVYRPHICNVGYEPFPKIEGCAMKMEKADG